MNTYFYKIENDIDFVWRIRKVDDDPYQEGELIGEYLVGNVYTHTDHLITDKQDLYRLKLLNGFKEILSGSFNAENATYDPVLGTLRMDKDMLNLYTYRHLHYLKAIVPISFESNLLIKEVRDLYLKVIEPDSRLADQIFNTAFDRYKSYGLDDGISEIGDFKSTLSPGEISLIDPEEGLVSYFFRPSWDEEHGLYIMVNFKENTCGIDH